MIYFLWKIELMRLYLPMCICVWLYIRHTYAHIHNHLCPNLPPSYGDVCINPCWWMRHISSIPPVSPSPCPTSPFLRRPLLPGPPPHRGDSFEVSSRQGCSLTQLPAQSWLNVLFPVSAISPVVGKLPREKEQRSGVYRMSVFKVTLYVSHFFFF